LSDQTRTVSKYTLGSPIPRQTRPDDRTTTQCSLQYQCIAVSFDSILVYHHSGTEDPSAHLLSIQILVLLENKKTKIDRSTVVGYCKRKPILPVPNQKSPPLYSSVPDQTTYRISATIRSAQPDSTTPKPRCHSSSAQIGKRKLE
jgi:hypothetical protein